MGPDWTLKAGPGSALIDSWRSDRRCVSVIIAESGGVGILVNVAGTALYGSVEEIPLAEARRLFEVNLFGGAGLVQQFAAQMQARAASPAGYRNSVASDRMTLRTTLRDRFSSRQIALIGFFCTKYARRIFAIVSTTSIPILAPMMLMEANVAPVQTGSLLDADHPENGVLIPRLITGNGSMTLLARRSAKSDCALESRPSAFSRFDPPDHTSHDHFWRIENSCRSSRKYHSSKSADNSPKPRCRPKLQSTPPLGAVSGRQCAAALNPLMVKTAFSHQSRRHYLSGNLAEAQPPSLSQR